MAPIMVELNRRQLAYNFIFTGQHRETIDEILKVFSLRKPDITLYHHKESTSPLGVIGWFVKVFFSFLLNRKKIWKDDIEGYVLNHGDTLSTLLGSVFGRLHRHKVCHIESGLRSHSLFHPFPEELVRVMVFGLSDYYFCPGQVAVSNISSYKGVKVDTNTNTLYDALSIALDNSDSIDVKIPEGKFGIASIHRFENIFDRKRFSKIIEIIIAVAERQKVLFVLHKPTKRQLVKMGLFDRLQDHSNIILKNRYDYFKFIKLIQASQFVLTDGGSNQEECSFLGKPCVILRKYTERQDGLDKSAVLCDLDLSKVLLVLDNLAEYTHEGEGHSDSPSKAIVDVLAPAD